ncbi:MAG: 6,7-dimethyl-8-ribityllumazine synthase [Planctomycetes bacterium]|nr:6,7-dimethyl-8-ribityllumazine synthase [Planctomycetota bacterium]
MSTESVVRGAIVGAGRRVAVVVARFNELVTDRLAAGARDALVRAGVAADAITVVHVPGAFELPLACRWALESHDAAVALGCVIRGATDHYEHVCAQASRGVLDAMHGSGRPVGFGLLTCDTLEQALERAGGKAGNKGADAAYAALEMLGLRDALRG